MAKTVVTFLKDVGKEDIILEGVDEMAMNQAGMVVLLNGKGNDAKPIAYIPGGAIAAIYQPEAGNLVKPVHGLIK